MTDPHRTRRWRALAALLLAGMPLMLTACQLAPSSSGAAAWADTCPQGKKIAAAIDGDASGTYGIHDVSGDFEQALRDLTARVAICGGHLRVRLFSGSNAGSAVLFDEDITVKGATANARARRVPEATDSVLAAIEAKLPVDASVLASGSDIVGQFAADAQYAEQLGAQYVLDSVILTDGLDNKTLSSTILAHAGEAQSAAQQLVVPELPGAWITVAGLGEVRGKPRSSAAAATLIDFYRTLCLRTGAEKCIAVSDYVSPIGG